MADFVGVYAICLSAFAYSLVRKRNARSEKAELLDGIGPMPWSGQVRARPRSEGQAAVMGLGAFSGYHRRPQLKHTY